MLNCLYDTIVSTVRFYKFPFRLWHKFYIIFFVFRIAASFVCKKFDQNSKTSKNILILTNVWRHWVDQPTLSLITYLCLTWRYFDKTKLCKIVSAFLPSHHKKCYSLSNRRKGLKSFQFPGWKGCWMGNKQ